MPGVEPPFRAAYFATDGNPDAGRRAALQGGIFRHRLQSRCRAEARLYKKRGWTWAGSGANPWHLDGQTESILFLTNESGQTARIGFSVTANGVHYYLTKLKLQPHETRAINFRALRDAQAADFKQHQIPASATDGAVNWVRIDNVPVEGRVVVIERSGGAASNYDCNTCQCPVSFTGSLYLGPASFNLLPGQSEGCVCTAIYKDCNGVIYPEDVTDQAGWSSSNTGVATVNSTGLVTAVAGGSASIKATFVGEEWYYYEPQARCNFIPIPANTSANSTVLYPAGLSIVSGSDSTTKEAACQTTANGKPATGCGVSRSFTYQVLDQNGNPMTGSWIASQQFWDAITVTSPNGLGASGFVTTCSPVNTGPCGFHVSSAGQFAEKSLSTCSTVCYSNNTCVTAGYTNADQTIHIGSYSITQHNSYYCDHVLVNGK